MKELPKYAREFHDNLLSELCTITKIKKKDMVRKMSTMEIDRFYNYLVLNLSRKRSSSAYIMLRNLMSEVGFLHDFSDALHFCSKGGSSIGSSLSIDTRNIPEQQDVIVDFEFEGDRYFVDIWKCRQPVYISDQKVGYMMSVYGKRDDLLQANKSAFTDKSVIATLRYIPIFKVHFSDNGNMLVHEIPAGQRVLLDAVKYARQDTSAGEQALVVKTEDLAVLNAMFSLPSDGCVISLINYVLDCYNNREKLTRKSSSASKKYEDDSVHVIHTASKDDKGKFTIEAGDTYVELRAYVKSQRAAYKGGASRFSSTS